MAWHGEGGEGRGTWVGGRRGILERRPWSASLGSWGGRKGGSLVYHPPPSPDMQPHLPRDVDPQGADWPTIGEMFYFQDWTSPAGSDAMTIGRRRPGGDDGEGGGERGGASSGRRYSRCGGGGGGLEGASPANTPLGASSGDGKPSVVCYTEYRGVSKKCRRAVGRQLVSRRERSH